VSPPWGWPFCLFSLSDYSPGTPFNCITTRFFSSPGSPRLPVFFPRIWRVCFLPSAGPFGHRAGFPLSTHVFFSAAFVFSSTNFLSRSHSCALPRLSRVHFFFCMALCFALYLTFVLRCSPCLPPGTTWVPPCLFWQWISFTLMSVISSVPPYLRRCLYSGFFDLLGCFLLRRFWM